MRFGTWLLLGLLGVATQARAEEDCAPDRDDVGHTTQRELVIERISQAGGGSNAVTKILRVYRDGRYESWTQRCKLEGQLSFAVTDLLVDIRKTRFFTTTNERETCADCGRMILRISFQGQRRMLYGSRLPAPGLRAWELIDKGIPRQCK